MVIRAKTTEIYLGSSDPHQAKKPHIYLKFYYSDALINSSSKSEQSRVPGSTGVAL